MPFTGKPLDEVDVDLCGLPEELTRLLSNIPPELQIVQSEEEESLAFENDTVGASSSESESSSDVEELQSVADEVNVPTGVPEEDEGWEPIEQGLDPEELTQGGGGVILREITDGGDDDERHGGDCEEA
jgi:hypothetical protein